MKSIVRKYTIVTVVILSLMFLISGIINVNEETSYVISGEKADVVRVQSTTSQRLMVETSEQDNAKVIFVNPQNIKNNAIMFAGLLPSPFSQILWGFAG